MQLPMLTRLSSFRITLDWIGAGPGYQEYVLTVIYDALSHHQLHHAKATECKFSPTLFPLGIQTDDDYDEERASESLLSHSYIQK